jgi:hypothetical protein
VVRCILDANWNLGLRGYSQNNLKGIRETARWQPEVQVEEQARGGMPATLTVPPFSVGISSYPVQSTAGCGSVMAQYSEWGDRTRP